ncbi:MAG: AAA family ATPase [Deltaproteobacteria bacterium]|jgi:chromosome segregation protein|nr:AAA family ATPase [Deltaproteobacteria bacterium]
MFLKRLEIVGFKSFTDRQVVPFSPGISSVVGPNGCGKSNIIDAIRWVMGEQSPRRLRARNMEDIMFNGSQGRAPAALAEVTLVLARELESGPGLAEVGVTRRLYRNGDSEYLINRTPSRLKDVLRFFMEAGMGTRAYNIIEQEKVGRLVDARPEDRRSLFDEAAGIVRFKEQKKESEKKIESAERNLTAVEALLAETKKSLNEVSKAAAKANKYKALKEELKELDLTLSARRYLELRALRANLKLDNSDRKASLIALEAEVTEAELALEGLRLEETSLESRLEEELAAFHELRNSLESSRLEMEHAQETLAGASGRREKALTELNELDSERDRRSLERDELAGSLDRLKEESQTTSALRDELKERWRVVKNALNAQAQERDAAQERLIKTREELQVLRETLAGSESLLGILAERRKDLELEKNQGELAMTEAQDKLAARIRFKTVLDEDLKTKEEELIERREALEEAKEGLEAATRELSRIENEVAALTARLHTLEDLKSGFSWYPAGVKTLMSEPTLAGALMGPVAESLNPPEGYEAAVEAALGERLAWIVTRDRAGAMAAVKIAKEKKLGRSGFVAYNELESKNLLDSLIGKVSLAEDLDEPLGDKFLTKTGEYVNKAVVVGGGAAEGSNDQGLLARLKEVEAAEDKLDELKITLDAEKSKVDLARENRLRTESALVASQSAKEGLVADLAEANSKIMLAQSDVKALQIRQGSLAGEVEQVVARLTDTENRMAKDVQTREALTADLTAQEEIFIQLKDAASEKEAELTELQERSQGASAEAEAALERLDNASKSLKSAEEWLDNLDNRRLDLFNDAETLGLEIETLTAKIAGFKVEAEGLPERVSQAESSVANLRRIREEGRGEATKREEVARDTRKKREEAAQELSQLERNSQEVEFDLTRLAENLHNDWRATLVDPEDPDPVATAPEEERLEETLEGDPEDSLEDNLEGDLEESLEGGLDDNLADNQADNLADNLEGGLEGSDPSAESSAEFNGEALYEALGDPFGANGLLSPLDDPLGLAAFEALSPENPVSLDQPGASLLTAGDPSEITANPATDEASPQDPALLGDETLEGAPNEGQWPKPVEPPLEVIDAREWAAKEVPAGAEATRKKLKDRLSTMGEISLTSIEKEVELQEKYDYYKGHYDDITKGIADLKKGISRVNQTCRELFSKTFKEADAKFREIFPVLFEGGEGWLGLSDENDPLESGVEIHVHPPGKKIMVMSLLSGGEKALTALALIFALYLIKPSPFCLLDEADAPLDEANIDRFNRLLRRLSEASQIIMVTHNKRTMQICDTLYGVTMETPGVSRLVSVSLAQAEVLTDV